MRFKANQDATTHGNTMLGEAQETCRASACNTIQGMQGRHHARQHRVSDCLSARNSTHTLGMHALTPLLLHVKTNWNMRATHTLPKR